MNKVTKQETSVPVQCRVSVITLAGLARYWRDSGYEIKTVSQLVSWSMYLLTEILSNNGQIEKEMEIAESRKYLVNNGLYQKGTADRSYKKLSAAIRFEGMRERGEEPEGSYDKAIRRDYNILHRAPNKYTGETSSVEPFDGEVDSKYVRDAVEIFESLDTSKIGSLFDSQVKVERKEGSDKVVSRVELSEEHKAKMKELEKAREYNPLGRIDERFEDIAKRDREEQEELDRFIMKRTPNVKEGEDNGSV